MSQPSDLRISVVAPTYKRRDALPAFVEPLLREPELHELVIAVDGSDDGSVEWLTKRGQTDTRLVALDLPNGGAGFARQAGIEAASGEVILLLDDDVIARPGLVAGHVHHHRALEPKLVLGYMPNDWRRVPRGRRGIAYLYWRTYQERCALFAADPALVLHAFWGGHFSMPRADFLRVGMTGLAVKRGQDDRDFGIRCAKVGIRAVFDQSLRAEHIYSRTLHAYRHDSWVQGQSRTLLHRAHPETLGEELTEVPGPSHVADAVGMGLPGPVRRLWPLLARDPLYPIVTGGLAAMFAVGVRVGHLGLEFQTARAVGSLATMRGVIDTA